jgi:internalin A
MPNTKILANISLLVIYKLYYINTIMKTSILCSFLLLVVNFTANAQVKTLAQPSETEKKEFQNFIKEYEMLLQVMSGNDENLRKKTSSNFSKKLIAHPNVHVWNDLETTTDHNSNIRIFAYTLKLPNAYTSKTSITIDTENAKFSPYQYDQLRNHNFIEVTATKKVQWSAVRDTLITLTNEDSVTYETIVKDTLERTIESPLTFYIKYVPTDLGIQYLQLLGIAHPKGKPVLEPLHANILWWQDLDDEWKNYIKKNWKLEGEIPKIYEIDKITGSYELNMLNLPIQNPEPLSKFRNIEKLDASGTSIKDLEFLKGMQRLKILDISKTAITSLAGLERLSMLEELNCSGLKLTNISPLEGLTNLMILDCSENDIEDLSPLAALVNLKKLDISLNYKAKNVEPLSQLTNLEKLSMRKLEIKTLEPIKKLINLVHLDCYNSGITTLEPIRNLYKLMYLDCSHNLITSLEPIKNANFITDLHIGGTAISDLSDIKNYIYLRSIICNNTPLTSLGPLHKFDTIQELKCHYTRVSKEEVQRFKKSHPKCKITYY